MLFNSVEYVIFLPVIFMVYWLLPYRFQWIILLCSSCIFYMSWNVKYIFLILFSAAVSYSSALLIERYHRKRKIIFLSGAASCLLMLFIFKYLNFFFEILNDLFEVCCIDISLPMLELILPAGISFYTFQSLSYIIDVYNKKIPAEKHFGRYAAFITFFPQLVAGPIERTENLLKQIKEKHVFNYERSVSGLKIIAFGYYKKVVIADNMSLYADIVFNNVREYTGFSFIAAALCFSMQIYCDFSGYSDIAAGTAKLFGIDLMRNFHSPYFSKSFKEFWQRWHISLSSWFRDYVYIPLGGNRKGKYRTYFNLLVTFILSGLWHGADWTFLAWGGVHGIFQIVEKEFKNKGHKKRKHSTAVNVFDTLLVFLAVTACWVVFRAENIQDAVYVFANCFRDAIHLKSYFINGLRDLQIDLRAGIQLMISFMILAVWDYTELHGSMFEKIKLCPAWFRWSIYYVLVFIIILWGNFGNNQFVYFQF